MSSLYTLKEGTPLVHVTRSKKFALDPSKALWLSQVGPEGLGVQYMGSTKKVYFSPQRDLELFVFNESGDALQKDLTRAIGLVEEAVHGGNLPASAIDEAKEALDNALSSDGSRWSSNASVDRDLVNALEESFRLLDIDGWTREFGNNREFLVLKPGSVLSQSDSKKGSGLPDRGSMFHEGFNRRSGVGVNGSKL